MVKGFVLSLLLTKDFRARERHLLGLALMQSVHCRKRVDLVEHLLVGLTSASNDGQVVGVGFVENGDSAFLDDVAKVSQIADEVEEEVEDDVKQDNGEHTALEQAYVI